MRSITWTVELPAKPGTSFEINGADSSVGVGGASREFPGELLMLKMKKKKKN